MTKNIPGPARDAALDLTRATLTLLVIAHHAVLAYHPYAPPAGAFTRANMIWGAFPVVDAARAPGIDAFVLWNDSFFMAMMFLLAGLFVPSSLRRKGAGTFLCDRGWRLGGPFIVSAAVLAPLAYLPAYLMRAAETGAPGFWPAWRALGQWPAGPAWFLWVLFAFSVLAAALQAWAPRAFDKLAALGARGLVSPARTCGVFCAAAAAIYAATALIVNPFGWSSWGPFTAQSARIPLYALYFFVGCALGAGAPAVLGNWMTPAGPLARRWKTWLAVAGVVFAGFVVMLIMALTKLGKGEDAPLVYLVTNILFGTTGVVTTFALLAWFARKERGHSPIAASLARNAYGMYLVHYVIVTWLQFVLLGADLPGWVKAGLVTALAIAASWLAASLWRRVPGIGAGGKLKPEN
jgi:peptidoglycan/LPS O-acetylase OafA/YrhL